MNTIRVVLILILGGVCASSLVFTHFTKRLVPAICVEVGNPTGGGGNYLPAIDGYAAGPGSSSGSNGILSWCVANSYKVVASSPGHFFVLGHYKIEQNGQLTQVDCALPVYPQKPETSQYTRLNGDLTAYAYMSSTTLTY